jgi:sec-independent protein translocase protein TatA
MGGAFSFWHLGILVLIAVLLFGRGKISELMGDFAKGIKSFKKGMADDETKEPKSLTGDPKETPAKREETRTT